MNASSISALRLIAAVCDVEDRIALRPEESQVRGPDGVCGIVPSDPADARVRIDELRWRDGSAGRPDAQLDRASRLRIDEQRGRAPLLRSEERRVGKECRSRW